MAETPQIIDGDGSSAENAVRFSPCSRAERAAAERAHVEDRFGAQTDELSVMHFTLIGGISKWVIDRPDGTYEKIYFDSSVSDDSE